MRSQRGVIVIDLRVYAQAFTTAARRVTAALRAIAQAFTPEGRLLAARKVHGGMPRDAEQWPDRWQSTICAGLLCHVVPCPSDQHSLACTHSCHEPAVTQ